MLQFKSYIIQLGSTVWHLGIDVPDEIAIQFEEKAKRVLCTVNNQVTWNAAIMPKGGGKWFINFNKENRKQLNLQAGDEITVVLKKDDSKYGMPLGDEMEELLHQDERGNEIFHALTPGKQRSLLYIVNKPKSSSIRLSKAITILEYLKQTNGKIDFKALNLALKNRIK